MLPTRCTYDVEHVHSISLVHFECVMQWIEEAGVHSRERSEGAISPRDNASAISALLEALEYVSVCFV